MGKMIATVTFKDGDKVVKTFQVEEVKESTNYRKFKLGDTGSDCIASLYLAKKALKANGKK